MKRLERDGSAITAVGCTWGPPEQWVHELLAKMVLEHGFSTFSLTSEDPQTIQRFGEEAASALREAGHARATAGPRTSMT